MLEPSINDVCCEIIVGDFDLENESPGHSQELEVLTESYSTNTKGFMPETLYSTTFCSKTQPLPFLSYGDPEEVWEAMTKKEEAYVRDAGMLRRHPELSCSKRSTLVSWMSEVCACFRERRETFQLAVDYVDRLLAACVNVELAHFQLVGVTAVFIASKYEAVQALRLADLAEVTRGACSTDEIVVMERFMLKTLQFDISPITINTWLSLYIQIYVIKSHCLFNRHTEYSLVKKNFSGQFFVQVARLVDLVLLDAESLQYKYSELAAAALYHHTDADTVHTATGYSFKQLFPCIRWMTPFAQTLSESLPVHLTVFSGVALDDAHNIQTHTVSPLDLAKVESKQLEIELDISPSNLLTPPKSLIHPVLTPPSSNRKPRILR